MANITTDFQIADEVHATPTEAANARAKKRRIKYSNYKILINPNKRIPPENKQEIREAMEQLHRALATVFSRENLPNLIVINKYKCPDDTFCPELFKEIDVGGRVEYGPQNHCVHAHVWLYISHYTCMKLDYEAVDKAFEELLGEATNVQHHFVNSKSELAEFKRYADKDKAAPMKAEVRELKV